MSHIDEGLGVGTSAAVCAHCANLQDLREGNGPTCEVHCSRGSGFKPILGGYRSVRVNVTEAHRALFGAWSNMDMCPPSVVAATDIHLRSAAAGAKVYSGAYDRWVVRALPVSEICELLEASRMSVLSVRKEAHSTDLTAYDGCTMIEVRVRRVRSEFSRSRRRRVSGVCRRDSDMDSGYLSVDVVFVSIYEKPAALDALYELLDARHVNRKERFKGRVFMLGSGQDGLMLTPLGKLTERLTRGNYAQSVLDDYDHVVSDVVSPDP